MVKQDLMLQIKYHCEYDVIKFVNQQLDMGLSLDYSQDMPDRKLLLARNVEMSEKLTNIDYRNNIVKIVADHIIANYACNFKTTGYNSENQREIFMESIKKNVDSEQVVRYAQIAMEEYDKALENAKVKVSAR